MVAEGLSSVLGGATLGIIVLAIVISGFFMWIGAKIAGVDECTFGKAIVAAFGVSSITWIVTAVLSVVPVIGTVLGFFAGVILGLFVIKSVFKTTWTKAIVTWIFNVVAQILALIIGVIVFIGSLATLF